MPEGLFPSIPDPLCHVCIPSQKNALQYQFVICVFGTGNIFKFQFQFYLPNMAWFWAYRQYFQISISILFTKHGMVLGSVTKDGTQELQKNLYH
jgi:hypothetical protein